MPRAKSVKPEAAPKPEVDLQQITIDKAEFVRTRDAVCFLSLSRRSSNALIFATRFISIPNLSHVGRNCVILRQTRLRTIRSASRPNKTRTRTDSDTSSSHHGSPSRTPSRMPLAHTLTTPMLSSAAMSTSTLAKWTSAHSSNPANSSLSVVALPQHQRRSRERRPSLEILTSLSAP